MASLIRVSDAGAIALHAGVCMAARNGAPCSASEMATDLQVSEAHLVKVLQRLTRAGLVRTTRGPKGGYTLSRPPTRVSLRNLFEAIEGNLSPVKCLLKKKVCKGRSCILGDLVNVINLKTMTYLNATTLDTLINKGKF